MRHSTATALDFKEYHSVLFIGALLETAKEPVNSVLAINRLKVFDSHIMMSIKLLAGKEAITFLIE